MTFKKNLLKNYENQANCESTKFTNVIFFHSSNAVVLQNVDFRISINYSN